MEIFQWIKSNIRDNKPNIIELGASCGVESQWFYYNLNNPNIICVEPDYRNIELWKRRNNNLPITLIEGAVSSIDGEMELYLSNNDSSRLTFEPKYRVSSSIRKPKEHLIHHPDIKFTQISLVKTYTLDTIAKDLSLVNFIWADIQGAEGDMIKGGLNTLAKTSYLYTEFSNSEEYEGQINLGEILNLLPNFKIVQLFQGDVLLRNTNLT